MEKSTEDKHSIDLDSEPYVPYNWTVEKHIKGGWFDWKLTEVVLYQSKRQQSGRVSEGNHLRKMLKGKRPYNANLLDYLLAHLELIPEDWKGKLIFFWGTIYHDSEDDCLYVRCLSWDANRWHWLPLWLGRDFRGRTFAAIPASS